MNTESKQFENPRTKEILDIIIELAAGNFEVQGTISELCDEYDGIMTGLNAIAEELQSKNILLSESEQRIEEFSDIIISIATLDFTKKASIGNKGDYFDAIAVGLNALGEELKYANEQLLRNIKLATFGKLTSGIAHDLRNPLGNISNAAYFLKMKIKDKDEKVQKYLKILQNEVKKCDLIISNLISFSKPKLLSLSKININNVVKRCLDDIIIPENIILEKSLDAELPEILVDPIQLQRVFQNIIINAIQAMEKGGKLEIHTLKRDNLVEITFKDTGVGILKENLQEIFKNLYTTKANGFGLGLSIVKDLIEQHEGTVEVESEVNEGTTFTVKLPIKREEEI